MDSFHAHVIATFEIEGDNNSAQQWALNRLNPKGMLKEINTTRWIEPYKNEAVVTLRDGKKLGKYTVTARLTVEASGFADAQAKIVDALTKDPAVTYINIQSVNLVKAK